MSLLIKINNPQIIPETLTSKQKALPLGITSISHHLHLKGRLQARSPEIPHYNQKVSVQSIAKELINAVDLFTGNKNIRLQIHKYSR
jgi:hypothetical protein